MITRVTRRLSILACLAVALVLAGVAPAFAASATIPSFAPRAPYAATSLRPAALTPSALPAGWSAIELPMGTSQHKGSLSGTGGKIIGIPLYAGQSVHLELRGSNPQEWEMDLWNEYTNNEEPVAYAWTGYPIVVDYTAIPVQADYGEGMNVYDFSWHSLYIFPPDTGGSYTLTWSITDPPVDAKVHRIAGVNRFETSADISQWAFPSADTVVLATGRNFVDALAASSLCGSYDAPLLLTEPGSVPSVISGAITAMGAKTVFIIGDTKAVSGNVQSTIEALPGVETSRVAGTDRYATSVAIAKKVREHELALGSVPATEAFVVCGKNFPDALSVSPYAYSNHMPILLSAPTYLPPSTSGAFSQLGITSTHVVGSASSVGVTPYDAIPGVKDRVIAGVDRYDTSQRAAVYATGRGWADFSQVGLATGVNFPDALGGGVAVGAKHGVLLLTKPLYMSAPTFNPIQDNGSSVNDIAVFGGPTTVSGFVMGDADLALP